MRSLSDVLASAPPRAWRVEQTIVLGWHDGPLEGLCRLAAPACSFTFERIGEAAGGGDTPVGIYRLAALEADAMTRVLAALAPLGPPRQPVWAPIWRFPSDDARRQADAVIDEVLAQAAPTPITVRTRDMVSFLGFDPGAARKP